jgi:hypothetical protein
MLPVGHILTATLYSKVVAHKLKLNFVKMMTLVILTNMIDLDHLIYYTLDDGTANSLTLHPGHIYSGAIIFLLLISSLFFKQKAEIIFMLAGGLAMHMAADSLAYLFRYSLTSLVVMDVIMGLAVILIRDKFDTTVPKNKLILFLTVMTVISASTQYFLHYVLKLDPTKDIIMYIIPNTIFLLSGLSFYQLFKKYQKLPEEALPL